jgi:cell division protein FtsN
MSKTDGEYELVLGNRQLLSAFFIIVILFGVFFTMGYVVGRNSAPAVAASVLPPVVATNQQPEAAAPATPLPVQTAAPPAESPAPPATKETKEPAQTKKAAPPKKSEAPPRAEPPRERPASPARESGSPANSSGVATVNPGPGSMYLQVAAAAQPQAGVVVDTLKQKGFPALLTHGPNPTLFRVMVGPYADAAALGKAKADLENAGFHPLVRK